jgi:hypothetical protein
MSTPMPRNCNLEGLDLYAPRRARRYTPPGRSRLDPEIMLEPPIALRSGDNGLPLLLRIAMVGGFAAVAAFGLTAISSVHHVYARAPKDMVGLMMQSPSQDVLNSRAAQFAWIANNSHPSPHSDQVDTSNLATPTDHALDVEQTALMKRFGVEPIPAQTVAN